MTPTFMLVSSIVDSRFEEVLEAAFPPASLKDNSNNVYILNSALSHEPM